MIIYKATNIVTGKVYVGSSTKQLNERRNGHLSKSKNGSNLYFHKSIRKYGNDSFEWKVLCECKTRKEMFDMEYHYIKQYDCMVPNGYNLTEGYDNTTFGYRFTKEQRKAQSERMMGEQNPNFGVTRTDEERSIMSKNRTGKCMGEQNPSKRPEVRKILSEQKMGSGNPRAKTWILTSPDGTVIRFTGGIKRKMKELGLSYEGARSYFNGKTDTYKGWEIKCISK